VGTIQAYATLAAARSATRNGQPDWILFRRGDFFNVGSSPVLSQGQSGRSASERHVVSAYGNPAIDRPRVQTSAGIAIDQWGTRGGRNSVVASLDLRPSTSESSFNTRYGAENVLLEDIWFPQTGTNAMHPDPLNTHLRRCVISGNFNTSSHGQGVFISGDFASFVIEECVFDMNGYKEDPFDPSKWTEVPSATSRLPVGTGVQPRRTFFDRNIYCSTGNGINHMRLVMRGNIISRGGGGGTAQMRQGGISERNVFMWNESVAAARGGPGAVFSQNLILHDDHMRPTGGWGQGFGIENAGTTDPNPVFVIDDSILAHFHRGVNGNNAGFGVGICIVGDKNGVNPVPPDYERGDQLQGTFVVTNNSVYRQENTNPLLEISSRTPPSVTVGGNAFASGRTSSSRPTLAVRLDRTSDPTGWLTHLSVTGQTGANYQIGTASSGGNLYWSAWSASGGPFGRRDLTFTFDQWQALPQAPDSESAYFPASGFEMFKAAAGWIDPERDIVSYMQSVDPTYIPNENVTTDGGVPDEKRRPNAHKVWHVMRISWPSNNGIRSNTGSNNHVIDENHPSGPSRWILSGPNGPIALMKLVSFHRIDNVVQPGVIGIVAVEEWYDYNFWSAVPAAESSYSFQYAPGSPGSGASYTLPGRDTSDDNAKLIARRYHAFLTFIERAKANRKGAWDPRYTADALNNYIREGFGKQLVGGAYDTRPIEDRFSDYI
jgi:hypothetical protein